MTPAEMREVREGLGLTQAALAELFGVHIRTVRRWEAGHMVPRGPARTLYAAVMRGDWSAAADINT